MGMWSHYHEQDPFSDLCHSGIATDAATANILTLKDARNY